MIEEVRGPWKAEKPYTFASLPHDYFGSKVKQLVRSPPKGFERRSRNKAISRNDIVNRTFETREISFTTSKRRMHTTLIHSISSMMLLALVVVTFFWKSKAPKRPFPSGGKWHTMCDKSWQAFVRSPVCQTGSENFHSRLARRGIGSRWWNTLRAFHNSWVWGVFGTTS